MTDTSKALELAERIFHGLDWYEFDYQTWCIDASRELRRQHAEIAELKAELERIRAAVKNLHKVKGRFHTEQAYKALIEAFDLTPKD